MCYIIASVIRHRMCLDVARVLLFYAVDFAVDHAVIFFSLCVVSPLFYCRFHRALRAEGRYAEGKHAFSSLPMLVPLAFITVSRV